MQSQGSGQIDDVTTRRTPFGVVFFLLAHRGKIAAANLRRLRKALLRPALVSPTARNFLRRLSPTLAALHERKIMSATVENVQRTLTNQLHFALNAVAAEDRQKLLSALIEHMQQLHARLAHDLPTHALQQQS